VERSTHVGQTERQHRAAAGRRDRGSDRDALEDRIRSEQRAQCADSFAEGRLLVPGGLDGGLLASAGAGVDATDE
jgi:hypothetical protein